MVKKLEFIDENFEQSMAGNLVCVIYWPFKPSNIAVLEGWSARSMQILESIRTIWLTPPSVVHPFPGKNPVAVQAIITNEVQALSSRKYLQDGGKYWGWVVRYGIKHLLSKRFAYECRKHLLSKPVLSFPNFGTIPPKSKKVFSIIKISKISVVDCTRNGRWMDVGSMAKSRVSWDEEFVERIIEFPWKQPLMQCSEKRPRNLFFS